MDLVDCFLLKIEQKLSSLASTGLIAMFSDGIFGGIVVGASGDLVGVPLAPALVTALCSIARAAFLILSYNFATDSQSLPDLVFLPVGRLRSFALPLLAGIPDA